MTERPPYSLAQLARYFLKLGSIGFGGPGALVGYMYRDLVEKRNWITDEDYKEGLTLAQLMPVKSCVQKLGHGCRSLRVLAASACLDQLKEPT